MVIESSLDEPIVIDSINNQFLKKLDLIGPTWVFFFFFFLEKWSILGRIKLAVDSLK